MKTTAVERWHLANVCVNKMTKTIVLMCLILSVFSQSAYAKYEGTYSCKSEQMIVVRSDMSVADIGFRYEFLVDINRDELILRFDTGHEINYEITAETVYGIISHRPEIGSTYSFFLREGLVERLFFTRTISTAFDTELRTGFCKKFG